MRTTATTTGERETATAERDELTALAPPADSSAGVLPPVGRAPRGPGRGRRAVGSVALAVGVLVAGALLARPPAGPGGARTPEVSVATLPAMPASMGFWDVVEPQATPLPPMPASLGFWDFVQAPAPSLPAMPNDLGFWDRLR